jgi:hypothetical protein
MGSYYWIIHKLLAKMAWWRPASQRAEAGMRDTWGRVVLRVYQLNSVLLITYGSTLRWRHPTVTADSLSRGVGLLTLPRTTPPADVVNNLQSLPIVYPYNRCFEAGTHVAWTTRSRPPHAAVAEQTIGFSLLVSTSRVPNGKLVLKKGIFEDTWVSKAWHGIFSINNKLGIIAGP